MFLGLEFGLRDSLLLIYMLFHILTSQARTALALISLSPLELGSHTLFLYVALLKPVDNSPASPTLRIRSDGSGSLVSQRSRQGDGNCLGQTRRDIVAGTSNCLASIA